ncbi:MAG: hypothetical protein ACP5QA_16535, partial [Phycisphaerae bacterium]
LGNLWLGFWRNGFAVMNPSNGEVWQGDARKKGHGQRDFRQYATCLLPLPNGKMLVGTYGGGVTEAGELLAAARAPKPAPARAKMMRFPLAAPAPTSQELKLLALVRPDTIPGSINGKAAFLPDDWRTRGNWIDRYGRYVAICAAQTGIGDILTGYRPYTMVYRAWLGPNCRRGDRLRYWVQWKQSDLKRVLQNTLKGGREESEWDDHGESYPPTQTGLGVHYTFALPRGSYVIATYFFNKDGHVNRLDAARDYLLTVKACALSPAVFLHLGRSRVAAIAASRQLQQSPILARSRLDYFAGGVYKRFALRLAGPTTVTVSVHRNHSFNTICCGFFVSSLGKLPTTSPAKRVFRQPGDLQLPESGASAVVAALRQMRHREPTRFAVALSAYAVPLLRSLLPFTRKPSGKDAQPGRAACRFLARCAGEIGLFAAAERLYFFGPAYESYGWKGLTAAGRSQWLHWKWSQTGYLRFVQKEKSSTWYARAVAASGSKPILLEGVKQ